jgi:hypothetical protein
MEKRKIYCLYLESKTRPTGDLFREPASNFHPAVRLIESAVLQLSLNAEAPVLN